MRCRDVGNGKPGKHRFSGSVGSAFPIHEAKIPVRDWIVPGLLVRKNLSVLVAPPASGKSLLTLQLAIAIALGVPVAAGSRAAGKGAGDERRGRSRRDVPTVVRCGERFGCRPGRIGASVYLADAPETIVIAKMDYRTKSVIARRWARQLVSTIKQAGHRGVHR